VNEIDAAEIGKAHAACRALEKPRAETLLEQCHLPAHRGFRNTERRCRSGEAAALDHGGEDHKRIDVTKHWATCGTVLPTPTA
jgi:hypothetical protein